ncbi:MAG: hypothetical protein V1723_00280 [Candidatus Uhrbacteria bacterium]
MKRTLFVLALTVAVVACGVEPKRDLRRRTQTVAAPQQTQGPLTSRTLTAQDPVDFRWIDTAGSSERSFTGRALSSADPMIVAFATIAPAFGVTTPKNEVEAALVRQPVPLDELPAIRKKITWHYGRFAAYAQNQLYGTLDTHGAVRDFDLEGPCVAIVEVLGPYGATGGGASRYVGKYVAATRLQNGAQRIVPRPCENDPRHNCGAGTEAPIVGYHYGFIDMDWVTADAYAFANAYEGGEERKKDIPSCNLP